MSDLRVAPDPQPQGRASKPTVRESLESVALDLIRHASGLPSNQHARENYEARTLVDEVKLRLERYRMETPNAYAERNDKPLIWRKAYLGVLVAILAVSEASELFGELMEGFTECEDREGLVDGREFDAQLGDVFLSLMRIRRALYERRFEEARRGIRAAL